MSKKLAVGMRVKVGCDFTLGDTYANNEMQCEAGREHTISGTSGSKFKLEGFGYVWDCAWLTEVKKDLTMQMWIEGMVVHGEVGIQDGNSSQRWRYNVDKARFESKYRDGWGAANINDLGKNRRFSFDTVAVEMTVADIEKALGYTVKVVK